MNKYHSQIDEFENEFRDWQTARQANIGADDRSAWDKMVDGIQEQMAKLRVQSGEFKDDATNATDELRDGFGHAFDELKVAFHRAKEQFNDDRKEAFRGDR